MRFFYSIVMAVALGAAPVVAEDKPMVLVELFTSEGCSSCPPADALLEKLDQSQPVPGVEIVALSQHVDYWNRLGWADPFSHLAFSRRQGMYGQAFGKDGVYTPQMVVDGRAEFVGSDSRKALTAIAEAAKQTKARVTLGYHKGTLKARVDALPRSAGDADVFLALAENGLASNISSGENQGRNIRHRAVVRRLDHLTTVRLSPWTTEVKLRLDRAWKAENLYAVLFLQDRDNRRILGVARVSLNPSAP